jgi:hypothetical protein
VDAVHVEDTKTDDIEGVQFSREISTIADNIRSSARTTKDSIARLVKDTWVIQHGSDTYSLCLQPLLGLPKLKQVRQERNRMRQRLWYDRHQRKNAPEITAPINA